MKRVIQLEEHEKAAICTVLDMLNQAVEDDEIAEQFNDRGANIGVMVDDVHAFLADLYHYYA